MRWPDGDVAVVLREELLNCIRLRYQPTTPASRLLSFTQQPRFSTHPFIKSFNPSSNDGNHSHASYSIVWIDYALPLFRTTAQLAVSISPSQSESASNQPSLTRDPSAGFISPPNQADRYAGPESFLTKTRTFAVQHPIRPLTRYVKAQPCDCIFVETIF